MATKFFLGQPPSMGVIRIPESVRYELAVWGQQVGRDPEETGRVGLRAACRGSPDFRQANSAQASPAAHMADNRPRLRSGFNRESRRLLRGSALIVCSGRSRLPRSAVSNHSKGPTKNIHVTEAPPASWRIGRGASGARWPPAFPLDGFAAAPESPKSRWLRSSRNRL